ncbi:MAG: class IIb bacteriocin, lactobin A/cerein 7B family [Mariniphaga sp.]
MRHTTTNIQDNLIGFSKLSNQEMTELNGGFWIIVAGVIGAVAAAVNLYEYGYNMVDKAFENAKK